MKQLTDAEKQELETKIKDEKDRQQALRENNPDLPDSFEKASAKTGLGQAFVSGFLWKYGFLLVILCLLAFNVFLFFKGQDSDSEKVFNLNLMIVLTLLFNHIAYYLTTKGWKSWIMKTIAWVWIVLVFVYMYISWAELFSFPYSL